MDRGFASRIPYTTVTDTQTDTYTQFRWNGSCYTFSYLSIYKSKTNAPAQHGAPERCGGLKHCISVIEASLQTLVQSRAVSQPAVIKSPIGRHTIGPASSGLGDGLAGVGRHCKIRICS